VRIGILALQGDFTEHASVLSALGTEAVEVRLPSELASLDGLIIPGGESTAIARLAERYGLTQPLRDFGRAHAVWGTCAGMILMARHAGLDQPLLELMDLDVERNAFGRQVDSFETDLEIPALTTVSNGQATLFHAVFIRAPVITRTGPDVEVLARLLDARVVAARQERWLATAFHPELSGDRRFHLYFLEMARGS
jgi:5'-phosphate synthase pdxT subunit